MAIGNKKKKVAKKKPTSPTKEDFNEYSHTKDSETFFLTFVGEYVEVCGSFFHSSEEMAIRVRGYLLDIDNTYLYLGDGPDEIEHAIRKDKVIWLQVITQNNEYQVILKEMGKPKDDKDVN